MYRKLLHLLVAATTLLPGCVYAQTAAPMDVIPTMDDLLLRRPRPGESLLVAAGHGGFNWGGPRPVTHYPTNVAAAATNVAFVRNITLGVGGQWRFRDVSNSLHDIRWWNVTTATNDQSANIQSALNYGQNLVFPDVYSINSPVIVTNPSQQLQGPGGFREITILSNLVRVAAANVKFKNLQFRGIETTNTFVPAEGFYRSAIYVQNVDGFQANKLVISGKSTGIHIENGDNWTILDNDITGIWNFTDVVSGSFNGGGIVYRDAEGQSALNRVSGFGQGVCGLNRVEISSSIVLGNVIQNCVDNGVYLVAAQNSIVSANIVTNVVGSGIKTHGRQNLVTGNNLANVGLGISHFGIHSVPSAGTIEYYLSTNKWGASTTNWFTGIGGIVTANTISFSGRHGIDAGYTTIAPNYYWNYNTLIDGNTVNQFGSSSTDIGVRASGDLFSIVNNKIFYTGGTNFTYGILFGGQATDLLGWQNLSINDNLIAFTGSQETGIQISDASRVNVMRNELRMPNSVLGIVLGGLSDVNLDRNILPNSQIRFALSTSTNVVGNMNNRLSVAQVYPPVGWFETLIDTNQITVEAIRTALSSTSATYPWAITVETNAQRGQIIWNKSNGASALGLLQVAAGPIGNSASINLAAYPPGSSLANADQGVLSLNSDATAMGIVVPLDTQDIRSYVAGTVYHTISTNGTALIASTNVIDRVAGFVSDPTSSAVAIRTMTLANLANALGVIPPPSTNGYLVKSGSSQLSRHLVAGAGMTVADGDGQAGNTVISWPGFGMFDTNDVAYNGITNLIFEPDPEGIVGNLSSALEPFGSVAFGILENSIPTNKINSTFYNWINSKGTGSGIAMPSTNGVAVVTGSTNISSRHLVGNTQIGIANGDGQSGNPTFSINSASITTNLIDSTFRSWVESMTSAGGGTNIFTSTTNAIPAAEGTNIWAHTLGAVPKFVQVYLLCTAADTDYVVGDIIPIENTFQWTTADVVEVPSPLWGVTADSSAIYLARRAAPGSGGIRTFAKDDGRQVELDTTKWVIYAVASLGGGSSGGGSATNLTTLASFIAQNGEPPSSSYATFGTRNSIGVMLFDPVTQEAMRYRFVYPSGYTATNATVVLKWTTSATSGDAVWGVRFMALVGDIDSDSFATAVTVTNATSATAGTVNTATLTGASMDGAVAGDQVWLEIYRAAGSGSDTINSNDIELNSAQVKIE